MIVAKLAPGLSGVYEKCFILAFGKHVIDFLVFANPRTARVALATKLSRRHERSYYGSHWQIGIIEQRFKETHNLNGDFCRTRRPQNRFRTEYISKNAVTWVIAYGAREAR